MEPQISAIFKYYKEYLRVSTGGRFSQVSEDRGEGWVLIPNCVEVTRSPGHPTCTTPVSSCTEPANTWDQQSLHWVHIRDDLYPKVNKFVSIVQPPVSSFLSYLLTASSTAKQQTVNLSGEFNSDTVTLPIVKSVIKEFIAVNVSDKKMTLRIDQR